MFSTIFTLFNLIAGVLFNNVSAQENICLSDTNNDGLINVGDLLNVLSDFSSLNPRYDINNDSIVNVNDILLVLSDFGEICDCQCCPVGAECFAPDPPCCGEECSLGQECGDQEWHDCGTSCPLICGQIEPTICNMMCNVGFGCPQELWWDDTTKICVENTDCSSRRELPPYIDPYIAIGRPFIDKKLLISNSVEKLNDWSSL